MRIALNLKQLDYHTHSIHLLKNKGENWQSEYMSINPQGLVPALEDQGKVYIQSQAIIEYLEETYPKPSIIPADKSARAYVRALAQIIACEIHPLNNLRVLDYLIDSFDCNDGQKREWYCHWIREGFTAIEKFIKQNNYQGRYCCGDNPSMADIFLIPQVYNAKRFDCDLTSFPIINNINKVCLSLKEFSQAGPKNQPDAEP